MLSAVTQIPTVKGEKSLTKAIDLLKNLLNYGYLKDVSSNEIKLVLAKLDMK